MVNRCREPRLLQETRPNIAGLGNLRTNDLERDCPPKRSLLGPVHHPHAARACYPNNVIGAESLTGAQFRTHSVSTYPRPACGCAQCVSSASYGRLRVVRTVRHQQ